jgi:hypothetical protein
VEEQPDIILTITDGSGKTFLAAAFLGRLVNESNHDEQYNIYDLLDKPLAVQRFTVVKRGD